MKRITEVKKTSAFDFIYCVSRFPTVGFHCRTAGFPFHAMQKLEGIRGYWLEDPLEKKNAWRWEGIIKYTPEFLDMF